MDTILSMERDSYYRDYHRVLDEELREAEARYERQMDQIQIGRNRSIIRRVLAMLNRARQD